MMQLCLTLRHPMPLCMVWLCISHPVATEHVGMVTGFGFRERSRRCTCGAQEKGQSALAHCAPTLAHCVSTSPWLTATCVVVT